MPRREDDPWLLPFLRMMRLRPGSYLGAEDVGALYLFISAYTMARADLGIQEFGRGEADLLPEFQAWLENKFDASDTRGWYGLIEQQDNSKKNVFTFLRLFDEFLASRGEAPLSPAPT